MDSLNEDIIARALKEQLAGKTSLYCAHRLSSISHVDTTIALDAGKVCEIGSHSELLSKRDSKHSELWNKFLTKRS